MKRICTSLLLGLTSLPLAAAPLAVNQADLMLALYRVNDTDDGVDPDSVILNLGQVSTWRENTARTVLVGNIAEALEEAFGVGWEENAKIRLVVAGSIPNSDANGNALNINGDPGRTIYLSKALASFTASPATAPVNTAFTLSASNIGTVAGRISDIRIAMNGTFEANPGNSNAAVVSPAAGVGTFAADLPPVSQTYFGAGIDPLTSIKAAASVNDPDTIGTGTGGYPVEAAVELFRMIPGTSGADLTVGLQSGDAVTRRAQFIGNFTLDTSGNVRFDTPAVSAPAGYSAWADAKGLAGAARATDADPDGDGVPNGIEFVTDGEPLSRDSSIAPQLAAGGIFTYRRSDAAVAAGAQITVEYDNDLTGTWTTSGAGTAENDAIAAGIDRVTVTLPSGSGRLFARLRVTNL